MAVGPDQMVDLEFLQDRTDERSAPCAGGTDFFERGERAKHSDERASDEQSRKIEHDLTAKEHRKVDSLSNRSPLGSQNVFLNLLVKESNNSEVRLMK